ncbi:hypothetical protein GQ607_007351, partial [Colletotrichum asianum]
HLDFSLLHGSGLIHRAHSVKFRNVLLAAVSPGDCAHPSEPRTIRTTRHAIRRALLTSSCEKVKGRRNERGANVVQQTHRSASCASSVQHRLSTFLLSELCMCLGRKKHATKAPYLSFSCRLALQCAARRRVSVQYEVSFFLLGTALAVAGRRPSQAMKGGLGGRTKQI